MTFELSVPQKKVVSTRGVPVQVVACAGSGKTESVSRRVAALIDEGESPPSIIAFTFTERAATELKDRIYQRVQESQGEDFLGRLGPMFVGTIHSYCFRLLQDAVPRYGNYDILDENRHAGFLSRLYYEIGLDAFGEKRKWDNVDAFIRTVDVITNELIPARKLSGTPVGECYQKYSDALDRFRFLSFGLVIARAIEALGDKKTKMRVVGPLRHLIVDEYQDINPAQERLIELLSPKQVQLCVVGDDDQSIYQWRGSDITNILTFKARRSGAKYIKLLENRRSRPSIVNLANSFASTIPQRLAKKMLSAREGRADAVIPWSAETDDEEAETIARTVLRLHTRGYKFSDIAVLFRSVTTSAPPLVEAFERNRIPYTCSGRSGLFLQPEIALFGEIFAWFVDADWKEHRYGERHDADLDEIVQGLCMHFSRPASDKKQLRKYLEDWKSYRLLSNRPVSLIGDYYKLLDRLGVTDIDIDTAKGSARFGAFARFAHVLADFEHISQRCSLVTGTDGKRHPLGGRDRGKPYFEQLHRYLMHYALSKYEGFEGEEAVEMDAVDITTVHQSKGLEWPVVFMPALTSKRFPSQKSGSKQKWYLPEKVFPAASRTRYEGGDAEERRLFYVALTRAREIAYLSCFERKSNSFQPSPYLLEIVEGAGGIISNGKLPLPAKPENRGPEKPISLDIGYSDVATYEECGHRYRLSRVFGFEPEIAVELGYGKAIHHVLRLIAERSRDTGKIPTLKEAEGMVEDEFYLPFADPPAWQRMRASTSRMVRRYVEEYADDLRRIWEVERAFELHVQGATIMGRADVILDEENGRVGSLAIVDYKTANDPDRDERYAQQLAVYAEAAGGEGLDVRAAYLHALKEGRRNSIPVDSAARRRAVSRLEHCVQGIRASMYKAMPDEHRCSACDFIKICRHA